MKFLPLVAFAAIAIWYLLFFRRGGGQGGVDRHFGLEAGEKSTAFWSAEFATEISTGEKVGTAALGLLAGALVGGVGIATVRPLGISLVLTNRNRLVMCIENEDHSTTLCAFQPGEGLAVEVVGDGKKRLQGGPTKILRLSKAGEAPVDILIHQSAEPMLLSWAGA